MGRTWGPTTDGNDTSRQQKTVKMGDATIEGSAWRLVEVGRVVVINGDHPDAGRLAAIVEIIDHKRVLVEGPSSNPELATRRQPLRLSRALLSPLVVEGLERGVRHATLKQRWEKSEIDSKWEQTNWAKKREQKSRRDNLTDFERFRSSASRSSAASRSARRWPRSRPRRKWGYSHLESKGQLRRGDIRSGREDIGNQGGQSIATSFVPA